MPRPADTTHDVNISRLYREKFSAPELAKMLSIPLHQAYDSLSRQRIPRRGAKEQRKLRFDHTPLSFEFAKRPTRRERELLIAGAMLYYGEGAKTGSTVDFANSDPVTIRIFLQFLRVVCGIDAQKLRCYLYCYTDQNANQLISYWSRLLKVPIRQFTKPHIRPAGHLPHRVMSHGVLHVRYSDKRLLEKILSTTSTIADSMI